MAGCLQHATITSELCMHLHSIMRDLTTPLACLPVWGHKSSSLHAVAMQHSLQVICRALDTLSSHAACCLQHASCTLVLMLCRRALDFDPVHCRARKLLGSARYALGDLPAARDALQYALAQRPEYADAQCDLGELRPVNATCSHLTWSYSLRKLTSLSVQHCSKLPVCSMHVCECGVRAMLKLLPHYIPERRDEQSCWPYPGCTYCAMNNVKEAKEHFEAAIRIKPNHLEVPRTLLPSPCAS